MSFPISYHEPLFRPPSEGNSLILQITLGCSWNKCAFCEMYTSKHFKARKEGEIFTDIEAFEPYKDQILKVFLADGDPLVLSNRRLLPILKKIKSTFPNLRRISTYASPTNIRKKSEFELQELRENGLSLLYIGIESGDNFTLKANQKGESFESTVEGINKAHQNGFDCSVMIINGVGGRLNWKNHAIQSAKVLNETQPKFASALVLTMHKGEERFRERYLGEFVEMNDLELLDEMELFMKHTDLKSTIFRSNHVSNRLVLSGVLGKDKEKFLDQIENAKLDPSLLRSNHFRNIGY